MHNRLVEFFPFVSAMLRTSRHVMAFVDEEGRIAYASPELAKLLQVADEQCLGMCLFDSLQLQNVNTAQFAKMRQWQGKAVLQGKLCEVTMQRTAPFSPSTLSGDTSTEGETGKISGMVIEIFPVADLSSSTLKTVLDEERSKLETLGTLSSGIAHDLNNILAGILGHVSFLKLSLPLDGADQESLATIEQAAKKAGQLTRQVLEYARAGQSGDSQASTPEVVALGSVVDEVVRLIKTSLPQAVHLETSGLDQPLFVAGDEGQLNQLILNLAVNARDAVGVEGQIRIEIASREYVDHAACADLGIAPGSYVLLSVRDTGPGIDAKIRNKIFEPFFTTKKEKGTGLGLSTVQAIVRAHRGLLVVDSAPGQGTCFEIALPRAQGKTTESRDESPHSDTPKGSERILIVDDEESVRLIMEKSLQHLGYEVTSACNGREALQCFAQQEFNLVIVDMIMPGMAGDELFDALRQQRRDTAVLIASGYASDARIRRMLAEGALGFIQKPFAVEELADEVRRCLDAELRQEHQAA